MNKPTRVALILAPLAVALAYPAGAWFLGRQVEANFAGQYAKLEQQGVLKVVSRDYQRGLFDAVETVSFELAPAMKSALLVGMKGAVPDGAPVDPGLRFTVRSTIQHGPLPGGKTFAAALVHSELVLGAEAQAEVSKVLGNAKPFELVTRYAFLGGGRSELSSPAFKTSFQTEKGENVQLAWDGLKAEMEFGAKLRHYTLQAAVPRLEASDDKGTRMLVSGLRFNGEGQRLLGEDSQMYSGRSQFDMAEVSLKLAEQADKTFLLQKLSYSIDMPAKDGFIDLSAKMGAEVVKVAAQDYGPVHYDFSLRHLQIAAADTLQRKVTALYADPANMTAAANSRVMLAALQEPMIELLKHQPEFSIDRLQFRNQHGEALLTGALKLDGAKPEDFANPMLLMGKVNMQADLKLPAAMAVSFMTAGKPATEEDEAQAAARTDMALQQVDAFVAQGYLERQGELVRARFALSKGAMTLNDKPFGPGAH